MNQRLHIAATRYADRAIGDDQRLQFARLLHIPVFQDQVFRFLPQ